MAATMDLRAWWVVMMVLGALSLGSVRAAVEEIQIVCAGVNQTCSVATSNSSGAGYHARALVDRDMYNKTGWGLLKVETGPGVSDVLAAYAAGYAEAVATTDMIHYAIQNLVHEETDAVMSFVQDNWYATRHGVATNSSQYWQQVGLVLSQFDGMFNGYNAHRGDFPAVSMWDFLKLQMLEDLPDVRLKMNPSTRPNLSRMSAQELDDYVAAHTHCSAIVKVPDDLSDIYVSHTTWCSYSQMLRLYKTYNFSFSLTSNKAEVVMFSAYPGLIVGIDDFYTTNNGLAILETTNVVFNNSLFDAITTDTVMYWIRAPVANRMATTAVDWHEHFYNYNSGTYNNQWMVVNFNLFTPGADLPENIFVVSEQLPGFYIVADQTSVLQRNYWPSYNVPFYPETYNMSGYPAAEASMGTKYSYQLAPRAKIFRRDAGTIHSIEDLQTFMRENHYGTSDPLAPATDAAIAARRDLDPTAPRADGAIDAKIVTASDVANLSVLAIAGPTHDTQPVFSWTGKWANQSLAPHYGHVTTFDFDWVHINQQSYEPL